MKTLFVGGPADGIRLETDAHSMQWRVPLPRRFERLNPNKDIKPDVLCAEYSRFRLSADGLSVFLLKGMNLAEAMVDGYVGQGKKFIGNPSLSGLSAATVAVDGIPPEDIDQLYFDGCFYENVTLVFREHKR